MNACYFSINFTSKWGVFYCQNGLNNNNNMFMDLTILTITFDHKIIHFDFGYVYFTKLNCSFSQ